MRRKVVLFVLVGGVNTSLYFGLLLIITSVGAPIALANSIAFLVAASLGFLVNTKLTFRLESPVLHGLIYLVLMSTLALIIGLIADFLSLDVWVTGVLSMTVNTVIAFGLLAILEVRSA